MPKSRKEQVYFGLMMCAPMVVCMTLYNMWTNGLIGSITWGGIAAQLLPVFAVALTLEMWLVGPLAHKVVQALPYDKTNRVLTMLATSCCMVAGMVLLMSLYGLGAASLSGGVAFESLPAAYLELVAKNFAFALPLQLILVGPLVRYAFGKLVKARRLQ